MTVDPRLRARTITLVGLMGAGKSSVGRRLASALGLPFRDADEEVERAAGRSVAEIFADLGEAAFRDGERRVIARLLDEPPHVLATGGGAFMNDDTRRLILDRTTAVWLKADIELLARRVARKTDRPLLQGGRGIRWLNVAAQECRDAPEGVGILREVVDLDLFRNIAARHHNSSVVVCDCVGKAGDFSQLLILRPRQAEPLLGR